MRKLIFILTLILTFRIYGTDWLSTEEQNWLKTQRSTALHLGFDPQAGMEYFTVFGRELGLIPELADLLEESLNIEIIVESDKTWGEAYRGLQTGEVDILFGANITEEREKIMVFTDPLLRIPYSLLSRYISSSRSFNFSVVLRLFIRSLFCLYAKMATNVRTRKRRARAMD